MRFAVNVCLFDRFREKRTDSGPFLLMEEILQHLTGTAPSKNFMFVHCEPTRKNTKYVSI